MKEIQLTQGKMALVDDEDFEYLSQWKWQAKRDGRRFYAIRHQSTINGKRPLIYMHRVLTGAEKGMEVDHIDMDGLNNQRSNLRKCTKQQNCQNRKALPGNSVFKGVSRIRNGSYVSYIRVDKKLKNLGTYRREIDAALAYNKAAVELFGEFARPNVI